MKPLNLVTLGVAGVLSISSTAQVASLGSVWVNGCVKQPGQYAVGESEHLTVAGLIAKAHGLTDEAGSVATVYRIANGKARIIKIDLYAVLNDPKADVELFAGDHLSVRERPELLPKLIAG